MNEIIYEQDEPMSIEEKEQKMDQPIIDFDNVRHQMSMMSQSEPDLYQQQSNKKFSDSSFPTVPSSRNTVYDRRANSVYIPNDHHQPQNNNNLAVKQPENKNNRGGLLSGIKKIQFRPKKSTINESQSMKYGQYDPGFIFNNDNIDPGLDEKSVDIVTSPETDDSYAEQLKKHESMKYENAQHLNRIQMGDVGTNKSKSKPNGENDDDNNRTKGFRRINSVKRSPPPTKIPPPKPFKSKSNIPSIV